MRAFAVAGKKCPTLTRSRGRVLPFNPLQRRSKSTFTPSNAPLSHPPPLPMSRQLRLSKRVPQGKATAKKFTTSEPSSTPLPPVSNLPLKGFATGALAGAFGSWVGLGGGFVSLPILTMVLRLTQHQAHGTSLCAVTATGFAGVRE